MDCSTIWAVSLFCLLIKPSMAATSEILQNIFATALAQKSSSFSSLATRLKPEWAITVNHSSWDLPCFESASNFSGLQGCIHAQKCLSLKDVSDLYQLNPYAYLSSQNVTYLSPALLYSLFTCDEDKLNDLATTTNTTSQHSKPSSEASWGFSFLFVTIINLCSLAGAVVLPCMKLKSYKVVLMFMVALAVGTLVGSGLLFLIPEAFLLVHDSTDYIWKASTIMGGIYLFYITEKVMRMINSRREDTNLKRRRDELATEGTITTSFRRVPVDNSIPGKDPTNIPDNIGVMICSPHPSCQSSTHSSSTEVAGSVGVKQDDANSVDDLNIAVVGNGGGDSPTPTKVVSNGHSHHRHGHLGDVAPVAYMIIFGDALHNFIDGLSIGSAFTQSIMTGVSVSVAVMCEELPHELGDFAILLNSGMHFKKAIMYNFLSACTCYLGTIIGILLGENTSSHEWIFAVAGGMFLYISLVDMMPEMNTAAESEEGKAFGELKTFFLQNFGLLLGFGIMLVFANYGGNISFD